MQETKELISYKFGSLNISNEDNMELMARYPDKPNYFNHKSPQNSNYCYRCQKR